MGVEFCQKLFLRLLKKYAFLRKKLCHLISLSNSKGTGSILLPQVSGWGGGGGGERTVNLIIPPSARFAHLTNTLSSLEGPPAAAPPGPGRECNPYSSGQALLQEIRQVK